MLYQACTSCPSISMSLVEMTIVDEACTFCMPDRAGPVRAEDAVLQGAVSVLHMPDHFQQLSVSRQSKANEKQLSKLVAYSFWLCSAESWYAGSDGSCSLIASFPMTSLCGQGRNHQLSLGRTVPCAAQGFHHARLASQAVTERLPRINTQIRSWLAAIAVRFIRCGFRQDRLLRRSAQQACP